MTSLLFWQKTSKIVLNVFVRPPVPRPWPAWAVIGALMSVIGLSDYFSGIDVSLAIFYLVPISLATGWLGAGAGSVIAFASIAIRLASDSLIVYPHYLPLHTAWNVAATLVIFFFVIWLLQSLIALHRQLEGKVEERTRDLRASLAALERMQHELLEVGARERNAIGRELHDELGQHLVATAMAAQVLARGLGAQPASDAQAKAIVRWIEEAIAKSRKLARGLLLASIPPERLPQELEELAATASPGGVPCRVSHQGRAVTADPAECAQLFCIAQEAVSNALRHAGASAIDLVLTVDEQGLCLAVEDDGRGLAPSASRDSAGMGLRIMEHRATSIGASLSLLSRPGGGTRVLCRLPHRPAVAP